MRGSKFTGLWLAPVLAVFLCRSVLSQSDPAQGPTELVSPAAVEGLNSYGKSLMAVIAEFIGKTIDAETDILKLLSETREVQSGKWPDIKPRLTSARALGAKGVLWFAQPDGTYYTVEKDRMDEGLKDRDYFPKLMAGEAVTASLVVSRSTGKKSIVNAIPVKNGGAIVGAIGASIFLEDLNKELSTSLTLPDGVYFYALSPDGTVVLHKSPGMIFAKARELGSPTLTQAIDEMFRKPSGETTYEFNGFSKRAFFMTIPRLGWKVVLGANLKKLLPAPARSNGGEDTRSDRARLAGTAQSIREFKTINGGYPESLEELEPPTYRVHADSAGRKPVYQLRDDGVSFDLSYVGPDGREGTEDDLRYEPGQHAVRQRAERPVIPWLKGRARGF